MVFKEIILTLPIYIRIGKTNKAKLYTINLNNYRNWHYLVNNTIKQKYHEIITSQIKPEMKLIFKKPNIKYTIFLRDRRKADIMNYVSIVDKFTCDSLVKNFVLFDDDYSVLSNFKIEFGGIDKINPRIEMTIYE